MFPEDHDIENLVKKVNNIRQLPTAYRSGGLEKP